MTQANAMTDRHFGIFRGDRAGLTPAEYSQVYEQARARKGRRDRRHGLELDDFAVGDVVVIKHRQAGMRTSGRLHFSLAEVIDVHHLPGSFWSWRGSRRGAVMVRVLHGEDAEYVGHVFGMSLADEHGYWHTTTCFAPELSHEEYHQRFLAE